MGTPTFVRRVHKQFHLLVPGRWTTGVPWDGPWDLGWMRGVGWGRGRRARARACAPGNVFSGGKSAEGVEGFLFV